MGIPGFTFPDGYTKIRILRVVDWPSALKKRTRAFWRNTVPSIAGTVKTDAAISFLTNPAWTLACDPLVMESFW